MPIDDIKEFAEDCWFGGAAVTCINGLATINAVRFVVDPEPDYSEWESDSA
ncbi:hypothetical protein ACFCV3_32935 [Kribbella sp. NPDC056345]|uniref:hypothetical protein n=1 Tax=Kribbella sp. NPDC056345 TaxID=3345789 RepID=UPI0035DF6668